MEMNSYARFAAGARTALTYPLTTGTQHSFV